MTAFRTVEVTDLSAMTWHIRVRAGLPFQVRFYGPGHWQHRDGQPSAYATRDAAEQVTRDWIEVGETDFALWGRPVTRAEWLAAKVPAGFLSSDRKAA